MKTFLKPSRFIIAALLLVGTMLVARADTSNALTPDQQRIAALEAYITNSDPGKSLTGVPGPGHNAWMMTSSALVLFMTLPGLALFYGGLVRRKNVLSVLAQCFLITGLVTILWWICGFSMDFGPGTGWHGPFWGDL